MRSLGFPQLSPVILVYNTPGGEGRGERGEGRGERGEGSVGGFEGSRGFQGKRSGDRLNPVILVYSTLYNLEPVIHYRLGRGEGQRILKDRMGFRGNGEGISRHRQRIKGDLRKLTSD